MARQDTGVLHYDPPHRNCQLTVVQLLPIFCKGDAPATEPSGIKTCQAASYLLLHLALAPFFLLALAAVHSSHGLGLEDTETYSNKLSMHSLQNCCPD